MIRTHDLLTMRLLSLPLNQGHCLTVKEVCTNILLHSKPLLKLRTMYVKVTVCRVQIHYKPHILQKSALRKLQKLSTKYLIYCFQIFHGSPY